MTKGNNSFYPKIIVNRGKKRIHIKAFKRKKTNFVK